MSAQSIRTYEFGPYRLSISARLLQKGEQSITLTPKAFDLLVAFVENSGRVLGKDELMAMIWPDTFVQEANLAVNISILRKTLGEQPDGRHYIETVPRRGYRFAADVKQIGAIGTAATIEPVAFPLDHYDDAVPVHASSATGADPARLSQLATGPPKVRYARSGDVNIAYQVVGDGPLDMVFVMGWVSHLDYFWREPLFARFLSRLASFSRLILFDKRGTGLSDPVPLNELPTLEQRMDDVRAVMNAVGSEQAALVGVSEGGPLCTLFAATYPEKTSALIMIGTYAKRLWAPDYPWAPTTDERERFLEEIRQHWGAPVGIEERAPTKAHDPRFREWWAAYLRMGASPGAALALTQMNAEIDIRNVLPSVRVPTLVIHRSDDRCLKVEEGSYVASQIPGARFVELPGQDHLPFVGDQDSIIDEIEEFLTGDRQRHTPDRVLATVIVAYFSDRIMASGESAAGQIDFYERFRSHLLKEIELFRGQIVEINRESFMATFDGPARAIRCARAIKGTAQRLGVRIRLGLHTGECDRVGNRLGGIAVEISANVASTAMLAEILVSRTVKDLVAGSGFAFQDRGIHSFGRSLGEWQLYSVSR
jgi:pimeloyl-ACP methyl ester carboxylesterase/DNA-binding winged helix-turn-helix (wHTH) protein/class 3 adenylate cyclase